MAGAARVGDDGVLEIGRGAAVERLRADGEGVEQSWSFAERPAGEGDWTVRVALTGRKYAGETAKGLHFTDSTGKDGLRYGVGTFIDADGKKTEVLPRWDNGEIALMLSAEILDGARFPAVLDPVLAPELVFDSPPAGTNQSAQAVAWNGAQYLVVWHDGRAGSALRGRNVDANGFLIGTDSTIILASGPVDDTGVDVVGVPGGWLCSISAARRTT